MLNVNWFLNIANPFAKPKYMSAIDSELVMWMKDEKECKNNAVEKILKFQIHKLLKQFIAIAYLLHKGPTS